MWHVVLGRVPGWAGPYHWLQTSAAGPHADGLGAAHASGGELLRSQQAARPLPTALTRWSTSMNVCVIIVQHPASPQSSRPETHPLMCCLV